MKKFISISVVVIIMMLFTISIQAQVQTATLQHNGIINVFKGLESFKSAYDAAEDGDTIFLSQGSFSSVYSLAKSITIQGSGQRNDTDLAIRETYIDGSIELGSSWPAVNLRGLTLEGLNIGQLYCNDGKIGDMNIRHCRIKELYNSTSPSYSNVLIEHCCINSFTCPNSYENFIFNNCYIGSFSAHKRGNSNTMAINNCFIILSNSNPVCQLNNCIIDGTVKPNNSCTAYYNVTSGGLLDNILDKEGNYEVGDLTSLFIKDYTDYTNFYKLTEEAASAYLGQDGTQVGLYGGLRPYTPVPSYPRIVEKSIAGQTTTDGKLRVYVKAGAQKK